MTDDILPEAIASHALSDFLYPGPAERSAGGIIQWWEGRRVAYNLVVGGTGLVTLSWVGLLLSLPPFREPWSWDILVPVGVFAIMANVCFTFGSVIEIVLQKLFGPDLLPTGPTLWRMGLTFSVGLTLLPALIITFVWVIRIIVGV